MKHDHAAFASNVPRLAMSLTKVAMALDVSPNSVLKMVEEGLLPPPRIWHNRKLWRVVEIDAALAEWPTDGDYGNDGGDPDEWTPD